MNSVLLWFRADDRQMAASLIRLGLGAIVVSMYLFHYPFRSYLWGPNGFIAYDTFLELLAAKGSFSVYSYATSQIKFEILFHLGLVVTLSWWLGIWSRVTGLLTYLFTFSLWERNWLILDGGDNVLIIALFFLMFARTDRYFAITKRRHKDPAFPVSQTVRHEVATVLHNFALVAILIQISIVYLTSALFKIQGEMWQHGVALYYVMRVQEFTYPGISSWIYQNGIAVTLLTYATVFEQLSYPFMFLNKWTKRLSIFCVTNMHLGIAVMMGLVTFSATMITLQAAAFRDDEYTAAIQRLRSVRASFTAWFRRIMALTRRKVLVRALGISRSGIDVYYDAWCARCRRFRLMIDCLDWLNLIRFVSIRQSSDVCEGPVEFAEMEKSMHVVSAGNKVSSGSEALRLMFLHVPLFAPLASMIWLTQRLGIAEPMYRRIADSRRIIPFPSCGSSCEGVTE